MVLLPVLSHWVEWDACHVTQVAVARKLAELAARPRIQIPASQRESGMARVDRWMAENTKNSHGMHLSRVVLAVLLLLCNASLGLLSRSHLSSMLGCFLLLCICEVEAQAGPAGR